MSARFCIAFRGFHALVLSSYNSNVCFSWLFKDNAFEPHHLYRLLSRLLSLTTNNFITRLHKDETFVVKRIQCTACVQFNILKMIVELRSSVKMSAVTLQGEIRENKNPIKFRVKILHHTAPM